MPSKIVHTNIDGRTIKLSNLDKVIYPGLGITKAQVIQHYLQVADRMTPHLYHRPLTTIRFPDGIAKDSFYSKDKPKWTPSWINSIAIDHQNKVIDYIVADDRASLVWLANLACLELHPNQYRIDRIDKPDHIIFDLDPDDSVTFEQVKSCAVKLRDFLLSHGMAVYCKTSGGKGLHLIVPIIAQHSSHEIMTMLKNLMAAFISSDTKSYTLQMSKKARVGKILIDIYRNHRSHTNVAPYSLRGREGAPVSMPLSWAEIAKLRSSRDFNILNCQDQILKGPDPWEDWQDSPVDLGELMGLRQKSHSVLTSRLGDYAEKRDMAKTSEPPARVDLSYKDAWVLQLHDASNLHYDLRLEDNGVLWSWAIPKGLPYKKGQKRLAIRTEDHPVSYLKYQGVIPKGQYGAGRMWIVDGGNVKWLKKTERSLSFALSGEKITRSYELYQIDKDKGHWMVHINEGQPCIDLEHTTQPMLATSATVMKTDAHQFYEIKWDGIRVLIYKEEDILRIMSRSGRDITDRFPELMLPESLDIEKGVVDGEIVVLDDQGRPLFHEVISRMHTQGKAAIKRLSKVKPAVCYLFDLLSIDGIDTIDFPLSRRREWLDTIIDDGQHYRFSKGMDDGEALFAAIKAQGMEGVMQKSALSQYLPGQRSEAWQKIKCRYKATSVIVGYTEGSGDRLGTLGALHLAVIDEDILYYRGKVGTGFNRETLKDIYKRVTTLAEVEPYLDVVIEEAHRTHWVSPTLKCNITYASMSSNDTYREPVFIQLIK